ncbi:MAG: penicillin-binding protein 2 [Armatimonadota bacterium]
MDERDLNLRLGVLRVLGALAFAMLVGRLWSLQIARWDVFERDAAGNRTKAIRLSANRGVIYDREGRPLAVNRAAYDVKLRTEPLTEDERRELLIALSEALDPTEDELLGLQRLLGESPTLEGTLLAQNISRDRVARLQERFPAPVGIEVVERANRYYPRGNVAAHVLGYVGRITEGEEDEFTQRVAAWNSALNGPSSSPGRRNRPSSAALAAATPERIYFSDSIIGKSGVERAGEFDDEYGPILQGCAGQRFIEVDAGMNFTRMLAERPPQPGASVYLTIDLELQQVLEQKLEEAVQESGTVAAAVVLEATSGEVLALASKPSFDPNRWISGWTQEEYEAFQQDPRKPELDRAIAGTYPPGSVFKVITAAAALRTGRITLQTAYDCQGSVRVGPRLFRCVGKHGRVTLYRAIEESCDIYFYNIALKAGLTIGELRPCAREFGFASTTGIRLPGEAEGLMPTREWHEDYYRERWRSGHTAIAAIGQGDVKVTPLQVAVATAAIANGGDVLRPRLFKRIRWPNGVRPDVVPAREVVHHVDVSPEILAHVREGMRRVVASDTGTGRAARIPGVQVAGKTGSAQRKPSDPKTHAWFTCFAPAESPKYVCTVFVALSGYGGEVAAPIARAAMAKLFHGAPAAEDETSAQRLANARPGAPGLSNDRT